jgi:Zn-finger nucleic acid-binding protein
MLFEGAVFCPHCGAARSRSAPAGGEAVRCPACRGEMLWVRIGNTDLLECGDCDGTWVEADAFTRLCADRETQAAVSQQRPRLNASARRREAVRYRPCPRCGKLMNRMNFGRLSGTIVDVCRGHGTFLDRGELHQVVDFILGGGLDRARQAEREDMGEERRRLKELLAALAARGQ